MTEDEARQKFIAEYPDGEIEKSMIIGDRIVLLAETNEEEESGFDNFFSVFADGKLELLHVTTDPEADMVFENFQD